MQSPLNIMPADDFDQRARIKVVGVGGAGGNAVDRMIRAGLTGVEFIVLNTDAQALDKNPAARKLQIGKQVTKGLGAGANPEIGRQAIEQDADLVRDALQDADMVFITAGMGGGTGTGAAPKTAEIARELNALTVAIVTKPFLFEGSKRASVAETGIKELRDKVDTLITIPNNQLLKVVDPKTTLQEAFREADSVLTQATRGISELIAVPGIINVDFADVRSIMAGMGDALMGIGVAVGEDRGKRAALEAISNRLLEDISIEGAQGVLVNITGSTEMTLFEVNDAMTVIYEAAGPGANVIFGTVTNDDMGEEISVTVIATGFKGSNGKVPLKPEPDRSMDFRPHKPSSDLDIPAVLRRDKITDEAKSDGHRLHLGEVDMEKDPPDLQLPAFLRRNNGR